MKLLRPAAPLFFAVFAVFAFAPRADAQRFLPDDPVQVDTDTAPITKPARITRSTIYDFLANTARGGPARPIRPAANVNTLGQVPDSSWFTNRMGTTPIALPDLERGPNHSAGPEPPLLVISGKSDGITPGFTVRDARGDTYFVKLDPRPAFPHLGTSADVIGTKFFHAFGYNVPENYLVRVRPEELRIVPDATARIDGRKGPLTARDVSRMLARSRPESDGSVRVIASRAVPGEPLGPFRYDGTRPDDPNDIFRHEDRRELRGLRVFAAWLNHDDADSLNTLDTFVGNGDKGHVRHFLIDFSAILGSSSVQPQKPGEGDERFVDWGPIARSTFTFGLLDRPWRKVKYREFPEVGRIEADFFRPEKWTTFYPNPAFIRMRPSDALWATRIVMTFGDDQVRAIVHTGEFDDPAAERHLADTIIRRRDKVVAHYLGLVNPLTDFKVEGELLAFRNLGLEAGLGAVLGYTAEWFTFDNDSSRATSLGPAQAAAGSRIPLPAERGADLMVRLRTLSPDRTAWNRRVDVFLRSVPALSVVGVEWEE